MSETINTTQQQTTTPTPEGTGGKLFTQDEVNKIVSDRLAREREKLADEASYRAKYEALSKELESMKAAQTHQQKEDTYRALLKKAGISEKRIAAVIRASAAEIDALELDGNGGAVGADKLMDSIKSEWADFIPVTRTEGAPTPHPPVYGYTPSADDKIADAFKPKI